MGFKMFEQVHQPKLSVAFWKHHPIADQSSDSLFAAIWAFQAETQGDIVKLTPAGNYQIAQRGGVAEWCGDDLGRRSFLTRAIHVPNDWLSISSNVTDLELSIVSVAQRLKQQLDSKTPLLVTIFSPVTLAIMLAGEETFLAHLHECPQLVLRGLNQLAFATEKLIEAYYQVGVDGVYLAAKHLSQTVISLPIYHKFCLAIDRRIINFCELFSTNILHIHGTQIHFDCLPNSHHWMVHFELHADNPSPEQYRACCLCPAVIGLPVEMWQQLDTLPSKINELLQRFGQQKALVTAECVVPLATPNQQLAVWIKSVRYA